MALKSEGFVDIDMSTLESVLGRETLNCKEMNLLEAALNWATAECGRREIEPTPQNKRAVLGNALYLIRIPTMTLEEFANGAAQIGILTQQETIDIFFHFTANNKPSLQYPIKPRAGLKSQVNQSKYLKHFDLLIQIPLIYIPKRIIYFIVLVDFPIVLI